MRKSMLETQLHPICKNLILLGYGMEIMGHAILDELFILIFSFQKSLRPPRVGGFILLLMPVTMLISVFFNSKQPSRYTI
jgi:hypothetical protein